MKPPFFALIALALCALANTIIERKIARVSPIVNTAYINLILACMTVPLVLLRNQFGLKLIMPEASQVWALLFCASLFFFADYAWFQAYYSKGRLELITATYLAFPIMAALVKGATSGISPTKSDILCWVIVAVGLIVSIRQPLD